MHALAGERVQIGGQGAHERLALAGAHLGDAAVMQHHAADELHVVVPLAQYALGGFAHRGEGVLQDVVEGLALFQAGLELAGLGLQLGVGQGLELRLKGALILRTRPRIPLTLRSLEEPKIF